MKFFYSPYPTFKKSSELINVPSELYQVCKTLDCAQDVSNKVKILWGEKIFKKWKKGIIKLMKKNKKAQKPINQLRHFRLLKKTLSKLSPEELKLGLS